MEQAEDQKKQPDERIIVHISLSLKNLRSKGIKFNCLSDPCNPSTPLNIEALSDQNAGRRLI